MQPKAGEAEVHRQRAGYLVASVIEQIASIGDWRRNAVAQNIDDDGSLVEMPEMKQFEAEIASRRA